MRRRPPASWYLVAVIFAVAVLVALTLPIGLLP